MGFSRTTTRPRRIKSVTQLPLVELPVELWSWLQLCPPFAQFRPVGNISRHGADANKCFAQQLLHPPNAHGSVYSEIIEKHKLPGSAMLQDLSNRKQNNARQTKAYSLACRIALSCLALSHPSLSLSRIVQSCRIVASSQRPQTDF